MDQRPTLENSLEPAPVQWRDPDAEVRASQAGGPVTILFGGLTTCHDTLIAAGLAGLGYHTEALPCPDQQSLQCGKEFGNRGQCNPTYFTVGNLLRYLMRRRDEDGLTPQEIIDRYAFVTLSSCGPCRFGSYATEYRKALRDAGFSGFRVTSLKQEEGPGQLGARALVRLDARFYLTALKCVIAGDVLNAAAYRIRPYETTPGATDAAVARCAEMLGEALRRRGSILWALWRCRRELAAIAVDRLQAKPKIAFIGEFWAMTTEGDGNYHLQRFLEAEGAEVEIESLSTWILYDIWCVEHDTRRRMMLRRGEDERHAGDSERPLRALFLARLARSSLIAAFAAFAGAMGLHHRKLPDMAKLARLAHAYYPNELRGGEGHMEVGKVILAAQEHTANLVLSVKPFGCMPSSAVSDGIQALVTDRFPDVSFLPIETSGDGAANVYSRVQMALFKVRAQAEASYTAALDARHLTPEQAARRLAARSAGANALHYPRHVGPVTAANLVCELA